MSTKQIAKSTLWQIGSQLTMALLSTISVKLVALSLTKELAGEYNSAYGYLQIFAILADFGLYAVSVHEVSRAKRPEKVLGALIVLRSIITILALGSAVLIAWHIPAWQTSVLRQGIVIAAFVPFFTLLAGVLRTVFQVQYKMHFVFIMEVSQRIITAVLMAVPILLLYYQSHTGDVRFFPDMRVMDPVHLYQYFLWVGSAGALWLFLLSVLFASRLTRIRLCFEPAIILSLLKKSLPYGVAFLCIALYRQFDLTMIGLLRDDYALQNAPYGFASRISEMTYLLPTFLLNSTLPVLAEHHKNGKETASILGRTLFIILVLGSVSALFSLFWARPIMQLLTTSAYLSVPGYAGADTALQLLAAPMFLNGLVLFSFYTLLTKHIWKSLVIRMALAVVLSISLNLFLIPMHGFIGATETSTIVQFFLVVTLFPVALKVLPVSLSLSDLLRWLLFSIILAALLYVTAPLLITLPSIVIGLGLAILVLPLLALGVGFRSVVMMRFR